MTCNETRDLFSPLADDALTPVERAALDAHLAGCAECRRELARFERTVKMVRALDPSHAPAGFVDRVLAAAQPAPWPRRVARRLARPWPGLPLGAAALFVVGGLAAFLFRGSVEQQRAARYESSPPAQQYQVPPSAPAETPSREKAAASDTAGPPKAERAEPTPAAPAPANEPASARAAAPAADAARSTPPAREPAPAAPAARELSARPAESERQESGVDARDRRVDAPASTAKRAESQVEAPTQGEAKAPASSQRASDKVEPLAKLRRNAVTAPSAPGAATSSRANALAAAAAEPPDVNAQLRAPDAKTAERSLVALAANVGGRQTGRRVDAGRVIVQFSVPQDGYAEFVRRAAALGALSIERQTTDRPVLTVTVSVTVGG